MTTKLKTIYIDRANGRYFIGMGDGLWRIKLVSMDEDETETRYVSRLTAPLHYRRMTQPRDADRRE